MPWSWIRRWIRVWILAVGLTNLAARGLVRGDLGEAVRFKVLHREVGLTAMSIDILGSSSLDKSHYLSVSVLF